VVTSPIRWSVGVLVGTSVLLAACAGPARTDGSYAAKAASTADQARSSVETVVVAISSSVDRPLPSPYLSVTIAEAEDDAAAAEATFESVQPPSEASDRVRARTTAAVGDAVDLLAEARILARRGQPLGDLLPELRRAASRLDELASTVER
jgi:hypothetical protein